MAHIHKLIDFTVEVFIVHKDKVLLRFHDKYNIWLSVDGHIELNENPIEAAYREVNEETGLKVKLVEKLKPFDFKDDRYEELTPPYFLNQHRINETHQHIAFTYFATTEDISINPNLDSDKSDQYKWLNKYEIEQDNTIDQNVKFYALKALEVASW